jgi:hypothetical protein
MNEKKLSQGGQEPPAAAGAQPAPIPLLPLDRRGQAFWGGMLAGIAIAIGLAVVMHVIQQASPNGAYAPCTGVGCPGYSIADSMILVLIVVGPIIGFGLGMGLRAVVPEGTAGSAAPHQATTADQPPAPST